MGSYRIRDWSTLFETAETRKLRHLTWVPIPNKHDGKGFRRLMRSSPLHYAAWVLIVQVASKCHQRGLLEDQDGPLTVEDLAVKTDFPAKHFEAAIQQLLKIGWLEEVDSNGTKVTSPAVPGDSPAVPGDCPGRREGKGSVVSLSLESLETENSPTFDEFYQPYPRHQARADAEKAWTLNLTPEERVLAVAAAPKYAEFTSGRPLDKIALPGTWLRAKRWNDEYGSAPGSPDEHAGMVETPSGWIPVRPKKPATPPADDFDPTGEGVL